MKKRKKKEREEKMKELDQEEKEKEEEEEDLPAIYIPNPPCPLYCGFYSQPGQFWLSMVDPPTPPPPSHTHTYMPLIISLTELFFL